jgi:allantoinase
MSADRQVIRGGLVVTPDDTAVLDVIISGERIESLVPPGSAPVEGAAVIDAEGLVVLPGAVDGHTHFTQDDTDLFGPDPDESEGFEMGGRGAAAGGVTTVVEMPQARPATVDGALFARKRALAQEKAIVDFALWGGVVQGQEPRAIHDQIAEGAVGFKAFMCNSDSTFPGVDDAQLAATLRELRGTPYMLGLHAENDALLTAGLAEMERQGRTDPMAHAESRPPIVEVEAVNRAIFFGEYLGGRVHIVHMSTGDAADAVAEAKSRGVQVTCETCPQYLVLDHDDLRRLGSFARCAPAIRDRGDVERLWQRLADGTIDCITTDHCAYTYESRVRGKDNVFATPNGLPGIETLVPLVASEARKRGFEWGTIARWLATTPAQLWLLAPRKGSIAPGADADVVLLDADRRWAIDGAKLHHTHKWTPYEGVEVTGKVVRTLVRGHTVYDEGPDGERFAPVGTGRFITAVSTAAPELAVAGE